MKTTKKIFSKTPSPSFEYDRLKSSVKTFIRDLIPDKIGIYTDKSRICHAAKLISKLKLKVILSCPYKKLTGEVSVLNKKINKLKIYTAAIYFSISILILLLIFLIVIRFVKKTTASLEILSEKAKNVSIENLNIEFPSFKIKEVNALSEALESMIFDLKKTGHDKDRAFEELSKTTMMFASVMGSAIRYGIIFTDKEGKIILFSKGAETMFGYAKHVAMGSLFSFLSDDIGDIKELLDKTQKNGSLDIDFKGKRKDGTTFPMAANIAARYNELLEYSGLIIITSDKTNENKTNSLKIQHQVQSDQLRNVENIIESLPIGIFVTDREGEVLIENEAAREILDFKLGDSAIGLSLLKVKAFNKSGIVKYIKNTIENKTSNFLSDVKYKTPAIGKDIYLDINLTPMIDSDNDLTGIIISFVDQTLLTISMAKMKEQDDIIKNSPIIAYKIMINDDVTKIIYLSENISLTRLQT